VRTTPITKGVFEIFEIVDEMTITVDEAPKGVFDYMPTVLPLTQAQILAYPDGTWIETDALKSQILNTWDAFEPRPKGARYLWRRKQLLDQMGYAEVTR
jgi:hypothetical protein